MMNDCEILQSEKDTSVGNTSSSRKATVIAREGARANLREFCADDGVRDARGTEDRDTRLESDFSRTDEALPSMVVIGTTDCAMIGQLSYRQVPHPIQFLSHRLVA